MSKPIFVEDVIAEKLKGVCDHRAMYLVKFDYGEIRVEEFREDTPKSNKSNDDIFNSDEEK